MDPLKQTLLDREMGAGAQSGSPVVQPEGGLPTTLPSKPQHVPPAWQRFLISQRMQAGYRNNWTPHPILTRILGHDK